jgi:nucleotide-binding universal stress UspA family protein
MYKKILVPLDGSALSASVLPHVAKLAHGTRATVTLLTVAATPERVERVRVAAGKVQSVGQFSNVALQEMHYIPEGETGEQAIDRAKEGADSYLAQAAMPLRQAGVEVSHDVAVSDDPVEAIAQFAESGGYDLLAMATHGREGISRLVTGSFTGKLLDRLNIPLLLVKPSDS